ncbi:MAG: peptide chain release factor 1 [Chloroflexi bacterium]|nr:peptide chain release factor 1 [Chloroflexota bacterium]
MSLQKLLDKVKLLEKRYDELAELMAQPEVATDSARLQALGKERASLEDAVSLHRRYQQVARGLADAQALVQESGEAELVELAKQEVAALQRQKEELEQALTVALLPKNPNDERDVIMEIRAGTGGEEAGLFAADLFRMYSRYAQKQGWKVEVIDWNETGVKGVKEGIFEVKGRGAYSRLKHESGVHRVQRVPVTEASGRIHTSTATVAVLPEAEEVDVDVNPNDLRIDIFHAGGHGGQNVQKVATAVRIIHVPTGITAVCQDERSQLKNKMKAMSVLRARLYEIERRKQEQEIAATRKAQVGTAERSEKIRTYNFPQDRVTDHRVNLSVHNLPGVLEGDLDKLIDALRDDEQAKRIAALAESAV